MLKHLRFLFAAFLIFSLALVGCTDQPLEPPNNQDGGPIEAKAGFKKIREVRYNFIPDGLAFLNWGKLVAQKDGGLMVFDQKLEAPLLDLSSSQKTIWGISQKGDIAIVSGPESRRIEIYAANGRKGGVDILAVINQKPLQPSNVTALIWNPIGDTFASLHDNGVVVFYGITGAFDAFKVSSSGSSVLSGSWSDAGLLVGTADGEAYFRASGSWTAAGNTNGGEKIDHIASKGREFYLGTESGSIYSYMAQKNEAGTFPFEVRLMFQINSRLVHLEVHPISGMVLLVHQAAFADLGRVATMWHKDGNVFKEIGSINYITESATPTSAALDANGTHLMLGLQFSDGKGVDEYEVSAQW